LAPTSDAIIKVDIPQIGPRRVRTSGRQRIPAGDRLAATLDKSGGPEACWPSSLSTNQGHNYIQIHDYSPETGRKTMRQTQIVAFEHFYKRRVQDDHVVRHLCGSKNCHNPRHITSGRPLDNASDAKAAGVMVGRKLTADKVREIVRPKQDEGWRHQQIAGKFGVGVGTIADIFGGRTWLKVTAPFGIKRDPTRKGGRPRKSAAAPIVIRTTTRTKAPHLRLVTEVEGTA
jgi:hypothetical protein